MPFGSEKKFARIKNRRIFASAFAQKTGVEKKRRVHWNFGTWDSVCQEPHIIRCVARHRWVKVKESGRDSATPKIKNSYNEEFDPGSGWTLAAGLTHASRGVTGSSNTLLTTGARVRNAYATYLQQGDNPEKSGLIPRIVAGPHDLATKASVVGDGHAWH